MRDWIKGGMIGGIIVAIISGLSILLFILQTSIKSSSLGLVLLPILSIGMGIWFGLVGIFGDNNLLFQKAANYPDPISNIPGPTTAGWILIILIILIIYFIIGFGVGAIIGLIIEKIKSRREKCKMNKNKKAQVWIETVIYTLIGLVIIGIVLAVATPQINKYKDKALLDQTVEMLNQIDGKISEIKLVAGNSRPLDIRIKKGVMIINGTTDTIIYRLEDSASVYSEPNKEINISRISAFTEKAGQVNVHLRIDYNLNITVNGKDTMLVLQPAPQPYNIVVKNLGTFDGKTVIDFSAK